MFQAARKHLREIATIAVASALVVAGVAAAQGGHGSAGQRAGQGSAARHAGKRPGPPPMGIGMKGLTYAQLHVQNKEGEAEVVRIDQGKVKSVGTDSLTLTENDGSEVTVTVDDSTRVLGKPGQQTTLGDLEAGQLVSACGPEGGAAKAVMVLPKKGERPGPGRGGQMPTPPGAPAPEGSAE